MRLFVAADIPDGCYDALCETSASLRSCVRGRYVGPDLFHVTLAFLGEVLATQVAEVVCLVRKGCEGVSPFRTTLGGLGTFGRASSADLWQGFAEGQSEWSALAQGVRKALRDGGFAIDEKGFIPHVTLMRRADVTHGLLPMPCVDTGTVSTVVLFSSDLSGDRPYYEALERIEL
ncbi:MAG: RNA 2',3'-cyclic phosphodiesterase [Atopobiaceae bacterium]|nr:RNA 2',3'-cyclic phosphodiesterase [Atopobiaceae bacterium]